MTQMITAHFDGKVLVLDEVVELPVGQPLPMHIELQAVISDLGDAFPGIESRPGVCGGEPCIVLTRIPVWVLEQARRLGTSEAELLGIYPTLRAEDIVHA